MFGGKFPSSFIQGVLRPNVGRTDNFIVNNVNQIHGRHLTPSQLSRFLYPQLSAYKDEDTLSVPLLNLSSRTVLALFVYKFSMIFSDRPIYVYVGYRKIIIYFWNEKNAQQPSSSSRRRF